MYLQDKGKKILQNQRLVDLWKIPRHIADDRDDAVQVKFVTRRAKNPEQFVAKVIYLYSHPIEPVLRGLLGEGIQLTVTFGQDLGSIRADPSRVEQVIMNLAVNARDAMPKGGRLALEISRMVEAQRAPARGRETTGR